MKRKAIALVVIFLYLCQFAFVTSAATTYIDAVTDYYPWTVTTGSSDIYATIPNDAEEYVEIRIAFDDVYFGVELSTGTVINPVYSGRYFRGVLSITNESDIDYEYAGFELSYNIYMDPNNDDELPDPETHFGNNVSLSLDNNKLSDDDNGNWLGYQFAYNDNDQPGKPPWGLLNYAEGDNTDWAIECLTNQNAYVAAEDISKYNVGILFNSPNMRYLYEGAEFELVLIIKLKQTSTEQIDYKICYKNLQGAKNSENPNTYVVGEGVDVFKEPTDGPGKFLGWFDKDGTKVTSIDKDTSGNIVLYARWETDVETTVTYEYYYNGIINKALTFTDTGLVGDVLTTFRAQLKDGFVLDNVVGLPMTLSENPAENVIKVYYKSVAPNPDPKPVPKTGDASPLFTLTMLILCSSVIVAATFIRSKKKDKQTG